MRIFILPVLVEWMGRLWFSTVRTEIHHKEIYEQYVLNDKNREILFLAYGIETSFFYPIFFAKLEIS